LPSIRETAKRQAVDARALGDHVCLPSDLDPEKRCGIPPVASATTFSGSIAIFPQIQNGVIRQCNHRSVLVASNNVLGLRRWCSKKKRHQKDISHSKFPNKYPVLIIDILPIGFPQQLLET
jgi:hypothetical protein